MVATAKITELNEWKTTFMVPATAPAEPIEMQPVPTMVQLSPHLVTLLNLLNRHHSVGVDEKELRTELYNKYHGDADMLRRLSSHPAEAQLPADLLAIWAKLANSSVIKLEGGDTRVTREFMRAINTNAKLAHIMIIPQPKESKIVTLARTFVSKDGKLTKTAKEMINGGTTVQNRYTNVTWEKQEIAQISAPSGTNQIRAGFQAMPRPPSTSSVTPIKKNGPAQGDTALTGSDAAEAARLVFNANNDPIFVVLASPHGEFHANIETLLADEMKHREWT
jgi:hypothetical protein